MKKKQKAIPGSYVKIPLGEKSFSYGRVLNFHGIAFYDVLSSEEMSIEEIQKLPIIFKAIVNENGVEYGEYEIIGQAPLEEHLEESKYHLPDITDENNYRVIENGYVRQSTKEECEGLDHGGIYDPIHIRQRLKDYFNDKK